MKKINPNRFRSGFTLVEIMIVVAIIGRLEAIAIPNFSKARSTAQRNACINNLRQIDNAKQMWATENKKTDGDVPSEADIMPYLNKGTSMPTCPGNGKYTIRAVSENPTCDAPGHAL